MTDAPNLRVSIVIPTVDAGDMLLTCLEQFDAARDDLEVILVDNGSSDGSVERARSVFPAIRVLRNETNRGYAPACNQGAAGARADLVLFLNNDAAITSKALDTLIDAAKGDEQTAVWQPVALGVDGELETAGDVFTWWGILRHLESRPATAGTAEVFATVGPALLVRRIAFEEIGGFEESYFAYYEESDLCWRMRMAGYDVRVVVDAEIIHLGSATTGRIFPPHAVRYLSFRNRWRTNLANPSGASLARIAPQHLAACLAFVVLYAVTGRLRSAGAVLQALWWPVGNRDVLRDQRTRTQHLRRRSDADVFRHDLVGGFGLREVLRHLRRTYWFERAADRGDVSDKTRIS